MNFTSLIIEWNWKSPQGGQKRLHDLLFVAFLLQFSISNLRFGRIYNETKGKKPYTVR